MKNWLTENRIAFMNLTVSLGRLYEAGRDSWWLFVAVQHGQPMTWSALFHVLIALSVAGLAVAQNVTQLSKGRGSPRE